MPSGSSGGSAAAVSADLTLGPRHRRRRSIRQPHGSLRRRWTQTDRLWARIHLGIIPLIYSLDHCGPMTKTVEDAAILLNHLTGYDSRTTSRVSITRAKTMSRPSNSRSLEFVSVLPRAPYSIGSTGRNGGRGRERHRRLERFHQDDGRLPPPSTAGSVGSSLGAGPRRLSPGVASAELRALLPAASGEASRPRSRR